MSSPHKSEAKNNKLHINSIAERTYYCEPIKRNIARKGGNGAEDMQLEGW